MHPSRQELCVVGRQALGHKQVLQHPQHVLIAPVCSPCVAHRLPGVVVVVGLLLLMVRMGRR